MAYVMNKIITYKNSYCHHQSKKNYKCFKHTQMQSLYMYEWHTKIEREHLDIYTEQNNQVRMT